MSAGNLDQKVNVYAVFSSLIGGQHDRCDLLGLGNQSSFDTQNTPQNTPWCRLHLEGSEGESQKGQDENGQP